VIAARIGRCFVEALSIKRDFAAIDPEKSCDAVFAKWSARRTETLKLKEVRSDGFVPDRAIH